MKTTGPCWALERVKALVAANRFIILRTRALAFFPTREDAYDAAQKIISDLTIRSFAQTVEQADRCDVYGILWEGGGWYLKFCIDEKGAPVNSEDELVVISLHPLEHPIKTRAGELRPKTRATKK